MNPRFNTAARKNAGTTLATSKVIPPATRRLLVSRFLEAVERGERPAVADMLRNFRGLAGSLRVADKTGMEVMQTALHIAAQKGLLGIVQDLVQAGATIDAEDAMGQTPLMLSAMYGRSETVKFLLSKDANPNHVASEGYSALIYAARNNSPESVRYLLAKKADINQQTEAGDSALHYAAYAEKEQHALAMAQLLMIRGIDVTLKNVDGQTASRLACDEKKPAIAAFIDSFSEDRARIARRREQRRPENIARVGDSFRTGAGRPLIPPARARFHRKKPPQNLPPAVTAA